MDSFLAQKEKSIMSDITYHLALGGRPVGEEHSPLLLETQRAHRKSLGVLSRRVIVLVLEVEFVALGFELQRIIPQLLPLLV